MLKTESCSLKSLKIAWNTIRFHSAVALVDSLKFNKTLTYLDISYNGLGIEGGETLGNALHSNTSLRVLKVAQNNITSRPCFTIFAGIKSCESLEEVDLSSNPIGEEGARGLLTLNITYGYRVRVEIKNCSVRIRDSSCWFNPLSPKGEYTLDMSKPYERAIALELMRTVVRDPDLLISKFRYFANAADIASNVGTDINPQVGVRPKLRHQEGDSMQHLTEDIDGVRDLFRETADRIFQQYDTDESGSLDRDELTFILEQLGLEGAWQWVDKLLSIYDTDNSGRVEEDEFISFLLDVKSSYENDLNFSNQMKYIYDDNSNNKDPYIPPDQGFVTMKLETNKHNTSSKFVQILSSKQVESLLDASKAVPDSTTLLELALSSNKWTINEAQAFFQAMVKENGSILSVLLKVLPHMATPLDARMLIAYVTNHQFEHIQALKVLLGPLYRIYIGVPNGFYTLNLSDQRDREAFERLVAISLQAADRRKASRQGDTSQDGTWQSFRNSYFENVRTVFTEDWLQDLPDKGRVEFDFVALQEVNMKESEISNFRLFRLLNTLGVVHESKRKRMFAKIAQYKAEGRQASKGTGLKRIELGPNAAKEVAAYVKYLYENCQYAVNESDSLSNRKPRPYSIDVSKEETSMLIGKRRIKKLAAAAAANTPISTGEGGGSTMSRLSGKRLPAGASMRRMSRRSTLSSISSSDSTSTSMSAAPPPLSKAVQFQTPEEVLDNEDKLFKIPEGDANTIELGEVTSMDIYGHHIKEMLENVMIDRDLIAVRILDALETVLAGRYLTSGQLGYIVEKFPFGNLQMSEFGTFRVELIISLFSRLTDLINFEYVLQDLENVEIAMILFRLGWLNVWNPLKPEGYIVLDLSRQEERQIARMLITLNYVETGETWLEPSYAPSLTTNPEDPNWKLPISWYAEETLPSTGILSVQYFSGKGIQLQGCEPNVSSRMSLMSIVLAQPFPEDVWHEKDTEVDKAEKLLQKLGFRLSFIFEGQQALLQNAKNFLQSTSVDEHDPEPENSEAPPTPIK
ncbi:hypothetical protein EON64_04230 [archaeon]|nr:MAG: hypothetical protein EON64_04230 [archaeon]